MSGRTTLYRLFGEGDVLLYVGIAGNPGRRFEQHRSEKPWWGNVVRTSLEHFDTRERASAAELAAIKSENPVHNIMGAVKVAPKETEHNVARDESGRTDRLGQIVDEQFSATSLVGSFFFAGPDPGWQGCIVAEPSPGIYLVELFSWVMGESTSQSLVLLTDMVGGAQEWTFFDTAEWMRNSYEHGTKTRWTAKRRDLKIGAGWTLCPACKGGRRSDDCDTCNGDGAVPPA